MSGKYKPYSTYKPSGVEWLSDVPEGWEVKRLKQVCNIQTGTKDTVNAENDGLYPFFVRSQKIEKINSIGADCEAVLTVGDGVGVGKVFHYYKGKFDFHQRVYMLNKFISVLGKFTYYYLLSNFYKVALEGNAKSTVDSLRLPQFLNFTFLIPPLKEQQEIVDFLDREVGKIEALIAKQERLVQLLTEKRQAVISHAVTKGLNPNTPTKPSAIEWLGNVPEGWVVEKLKNLFVFNKGLNITKEDLKDLGIPCVNYGEIHSKYNFEVDLDKHQLKYVDVDYLKTSAKSLIHQGDIIFADTSEDIDGAGNFTQLISKKVIFAGYHTIILKMASNNYYRYLAYAFDTTEFRSQIRSKVQGIKVFSITQTILKNSKIWLPPLKEQQQIANFLDQETRKIDSLIEKSQQMVNLLKERKTSLISAAVTGKIDVRN